MLCIKGICVTHVYTTGNVSSIFYYPISFSCVYPDLKSQENVTFSFASLYVFPSSSKPSLSDTPVVIFILIHSFMFPSGVQLTCIHSPIYVQSIDEALPLGYRFFKKYWRETPSFEDSAHVLRAENEVLKGKTKPNQQFTRKTVLAPIEHPLAVQGPW